MKYFGIIFLAALLLSLEVMLGNFGLALPLLGWGAFYLALVYPWYYSGWYSVATGLAISLIAGREMPTLILVIGVFAGMGIYWRKKQSANVLSAAFGAAAASSCGGLAYLLDGFASGAVLSWGEGFFWWYFIICLGAAVVPGAIFLLDWSLGLLPGYPQYYSEIKIKQKKPFSVVRSIKN